MKSNINYLVGWILQIIIETEIAELIYITHAKYKCIFHSNSRQSVTKINSLPH